MIHASHALPPKTLIVLGADLAARVQNVEEHVLESFLRYLSGLESVAKENAGLSLRTAQALSLRFQLGSL